MTQITRFEGVLLNGFQDSKPFSGCCFLWVGAVMWRWITQCSTTNVFDLNIKVGQVRKTIDKHGIFYRFLYYRTSANKENITLLIKVFINVFRLFALKTLNKSEYKYMFFAFQYV